MTNQVVTDEEVEASFQDSDQSVTREDIRHVLEAYRRKPTEEESELYAFLGKVVEKTLEEQ